MGGEKMDDNPRLDWSKFIYLLIACLLIWAVAMLATSCKTIKQSEKEYVYNTDTLYKVNLVRDSIYVKDSTVIREKGDTIFSDRWHTKYIEKLRTDTLYKSRVDSVYVNVYKEKQVSTWSRIKMFITDSLVILGVIFVIVGAYFVYKRIKGS